MPVSNIRAIDQNIKFPQPVTLNCCTVQVYDSDPKTNPDAKRYDEVSIQEVIDKQLAVVDLTASILSMENKMPMYVFGLNEENSIVKAISGDFNGTKVTV